MRIGEWRYSFTHSLTSALDGGEWSPSRTGRFTSRGRVPGNHWIGGWVRPRAGLDAVVKRKIPSPHLESNPGISIVQPVRNLVATPIELSRFCYYHHHLRLNIWGLGQVILQVIELSESCDWVPLFCCHHIPWTRARCAAANACFLPTLAMWFLSIQFYQEYARVLLIIKFLPWQGTEVLISTSRSETVGRKRRTVFQ
jgi:hypothetical protein